MSISFNSVPMEVVNCNWGAVSGLGLGGLGDRHIAEPRLGPGQVCHRRDAQIRSLRGLRTGGYDGQSSRPPKSSLSNVDVKLIHFHIV